MKQKIFALLLALALIMGGTLSFGFAEDSLPGESVLEQIAGEEAPGEDVTEGETTEETPEEEGEGGESEEEAPGEDVTEGGVTEETPEEEAEGDESEEEAPGEDVTEGEISEETPEEEGEGGETTGETPGEEVTEEGVTEETPEEEGEGGESEEETSGEEVTEGEVTEETPEEEAEGDETTGETPGEDVTEGEISEETPEEEAEGDETTGETPGEEVTEEGGTEETPEEEGEGGETTEEALGEDVTEGEISEETPEEEGEGGEIAEEMPAAQGVITAILDGGFLGRVPTVEILSGDPDPLYILMLEMQYFDAEAISPAGEAETLRLRVDWDLSNLSTDFSTPGSYTESAPIAAPEGYVFAEGVAHTVSIPVLVLEEEAGPEVIISFDDISRSYAYAIDQGADWDEFFAWEFDPERWEYSWPCTTDAGNAQWAHIRWENPHPNTEKTGKILVTGRAVLPEGCVAAEGLSLPQVQVSVSVQSKTKPALHSWYMSFGNINIPWNSGGLEEDESLRLMISRDGESWSETSALEYDGSAMIVYLCDLEEGHSYRVKGVWEDGQTGEFCFDWDGELSNVNYLEGDRDGGDSDGGRKETVVQQRPKYTSKKQEDSGAADAAAFNEESGETYSLVSGARLMMMRENGDVRFSKQGITVTLSDALLDSLQLREDSRFRIEIIRTQEGLGISAYLDGEAVLYLPDTRILLPADASKEDVLPVLWNECMADIVPGNYDCSADVVGFAVDYAGEYAFLELPLGNSGVCEFMDAFAADEDKLSFALSAWYAQLLLNGWTP